MPLQGPLCLADLAPEQSALCGAVLNCSVEMRQSQVAGPTGQLGPVAMFHDGLSGLPGGAGCWGG